MNHRATDTEGMGEDGQRAEEHPRPERLRRLSLRSGRALRHALLIVPYALLIALLAGCKPKPQPVEVEVRDLSQVIESDTLTVLTLYGSTTYFLYRGQEMGFQFELSEQFARSLGVNLKVVVARNVQQLIDKLQAGEGDLIAFNLPVTKEQRDLLTYCGRKTITHQVVVQRAGRKAMHDVTELVGRQVHVKPGKHLDRMRNLDEELGGGIELNAVENDSITGEDLIAMVYKGQIECTVADNDVAQLNTTYYPGLDIGLVVSLDQSASWAVRNDCPELAEAVNRWHDANKTSPAYAASTKRYFEISKAIPHSPVLSLREGKISVYDDLFRRYADEIGWDWRLLASLAYTESNFDPMVVSWAGAKGLMQLMPATARAMGIPEGQEQDPEESIRAAVKYIAIMARSFRNVPDDERPLFILASYNAGLGHVTDAMALAEKYGKDKYRWTDNVEKYLLLKSNEEYYSDPVCRCGYLRGDETYSFVREIMGRYEQYKKRIKK